MVALVTIWVLRDEYGPEQKAALIRNVTDAVADAVGEDVRDSTWVVIEEIQRGDWGVGGRDVGLGRWRPREDS